MKRQNNHDLFRGSKSLASVLRSSAVEQRSRSDILSYEPREWAEKFVSKHYGYSWEEEYRSR